jgi:NAD(P)H-hydrate repair Nnr-like enzyme with NAD(P)H-hydrate dehydratase domain
MRVLVVGGWKQLLGANSFSFFSSIYVGEGWSLILSSTRMTVAATVTAQEDEEEGAGAG